MALKKINYTGSSKVILRLCEMVNQLIDGGGGGSTVTYTQTLSSGTKTGSISIDGVSTDMYAPTQPTKLSDLSNDSGFITNTVNNLTNYYLKSETYTQAEVDALISAIVTLNVLVVQTLPTQDISTTTIYLVPKQTPETQDIYDEYIYVNNAWEHIGTTQIDLSNYYTKTEINALLADKVDKVAGKQLSTEDFTSTLKTKLDGIADSADAVSWSQTQSTGTKIAEITINGTSQDVYAPTGSGGNPTASDVTYDNTETEIPETNVQGAIDLAFATIDNQNDVLEGLVNPTFTEAQTRTNVASGDSYQTLWGKVKKFFTDLKDLAFIAKDGSTSKYLRGDGTWQTFPTIPTVNNGTLTIQKNGTNVQTFTANQSANATANIIVPTKTSELNNDSEFIIADSTNLITMINALSIGGSDCEDDDYFVSQYAGGNRVGNTNYYRRSITCLYNNFRLRDGLLKRGSWLADTETYNANDIIGNIVFGYGNVSGHTNFATTGTLVDFCCRGSRGEKYRFQLQCSYTNNHLYIRRRNGDASAWSSWSRLALATEIPTVVSQANANALINSLSTGSSTPVDNDYYVSQYVGGGTTTTTYHRRPMSALYNYILGKADAVGNTVGTLVKRDSDGYVRSYGFRSASSSDKAKINGGGCYIKSYDDSGYTGCFASSFTNMSSKKFKENIKPITEEEAEKLLDVEVVTYDYKEDAGIISGDARLNQRGVIAEQVEDIIPSVITYEEEDGKMSPNGVDYSKFVPYLIKMVQIQQEEINNLKAEISALKK